MLTRMFSRTGSRPVPSAAIQVVFQILVLGLLVLLLVNYKGAAGLRKIRQTQVTGTLHLPTWQIGGGPAETSAFGNAVEYLKIVWVALIFGVLISAAVRTSLSRTPLHTLFSHGVARGQVAGAFAGVPLMLCSCCVAPIFPAVYQRTTRLAPALAMTLASPSLNPAALTLSFILFPFRIAGARVAMALMLVFVGSAVLAKVARPSLITANLTDEQRDDTWLGLLSSYTKSLVYVSLRTMPLIFVGIWASMWIMRRLPPHVSTVANTHFMAIAIIALIAVFLTLPSFFEIPLALSILASGGPVGGAAAVLFAGPAINLSSLLVIGRYSGWKVAAALAALVWAIAATGGLLLG